MWRLWVLALLATSVSAEDASSIVSVSSISCNSTMKLACVVTLDVHHRYLRHETMDVSLKYYPRGSEYVGLWTSPVAIDKTMKSLNISVFRLRPSTTYDIEVYGQRSSEVTASMQANATMLSAATGYDLLDLDYVGRVTTSKTPSFAVMMFDIESDDFKGVVMVDNEGYPVWYHDAGCQVLAFDQFADYSLVINAFPRDGTVSSLNRFSPWGDKLDTYVDTCAGAGSNWTQINHEARVTSDQQSVLTVESSLTRLGNNSGVRYLGHDIDYYITASVALWSPATGALERKVHLEDYFTPLKQRVKGQPNSMTFSYNVSCTDAHDKVDVAIEWSHMSSVSEAEHHYIVALRNLDTVIAFAKDGSGVSWVLSSEAAMGSNFTFARPEDRFYNPHDAKLVGGRGHELLLIDDGNNRPGCDSTQATCYSRAMHYKLNFETMQAEVVWQFEFDVDVQYTKGVPQEKVAHRDLFVNDGGSITYDESAGENGRYWVALTATEEQGRFNRSVYIFEIDEVGGVVAQMEVGRPLFQDYPSALYRAYTFESILGERSDAPFALAEDAAAAADDAATAATAAGDDASAGGSGASRSHASRSSSSSVAALESARAESSSARGTAAYGARSPLPLAAAVAALVVVAVAVATRRRWREYQAIGGDAEATDGSM